MSFDPYLQWLGIRDASRPPNHYRLLGLELFEENADVIATAADRQMSHVRSFQNGPHADQSQVVLNELAAAKICLLTRDKKAAYDQQLRAATAPAGEAHDVKNVRATPLDESPSTVWWKGALLAVGMIVSMIVIGRVILPRLLPSSAPLASLPFEVSVDDPSLLPDRAVGELNAPSSFDGGPNLATAVLSATSHDQSKHAPSELPEGGGTGLTDEDLALLATSDLRLRSLPGLEDHLVPKGASDRSIVHIAAAPWELPVAPEEASTDRLSFHSVLNEWRTAIAQRDIPKARRELEAAVERLKDREQRSEWQQASLLQDQLQRFWDAVQTQIDRIQPQETFLFRNQPVTVLAVSDKEMTLVDAAGRQKTFDCNVGRMESHLAIGLAAREIGTGGAAAWVAVGSFLAVDKTGSLALARRIWQFAYEQGCPVELLVGMPGAPLPDVRNGTDSVAMAATPATRERPTMDLTQEPEKTESATTLVEPVPESVPSVDQLQAALFKIRDLYSEEYKGKRPTDQVKLAQQFVEQAEKQDNDAASRYQLWNQARQLAATGGNAHLAVLATDGLAKSFSVPKWPLQVETLSRLAAAAETSDDLLGAQNGYVETALRLSQLAVEETEFVYATKIVSTALTNVRKWNHTQHVARLNELKQTIKRQRGMYRKAEAAYTKLKTSSDDPEANQLVGEYLWSVKNNFDKALPFLVKGTAGPAHDQALAELNPVTNASDMIQLADRWWDTADRQSNEMAERMRARAFYWYTKSYDQAEGLDRKKVETRLAAYRDLVAAAQSVSGVAVAKALTGNAWAIRFNEGPSWDRCQFYEDGTAEIIADGKTQTFRWQQTPGYIVLVNPAAPAVKYQVKLQGNQLLVTRLVPGTNRIAARGEGEPLKN